MVVTYIYSKISFDEARDSIAMRLSVFYIFQMTSRLCIVGIASSCLSLVLCIVGTAIPYWTYMYPDIIRKYGSQYFGLWAQCSEVKGETVCSSYDAGNYFITLTTYWTLMVSADQELMQSEPKSRPRNHSWKQLKLQIVQIQREHMVNRTSNSPQKGGHSAA